MDNKPLRHAVIVGGTGMLRDAAIQLSTQCCHMTLVARRASRIVAVANSCACHCEQLAMDWHDTERFIAGLKSSLDRTDPADLVLAWIHTSTGDLPVRIAQLVASSSEPCRYVQIFGSGNGDAHIIRSRWHETLTGMPGIAYQRIILGMAVEHGVRRWLTDVEICQGVMRAIASDAIDSLVGNAPATE